MQAVFQRRIAGPAAHRWTPDDGSHDSIVLWKLGRDGSHDPNGTEPSPEKSSASTTICAFRPSGCADRLVPRHLCRGRARREWIAQRDHGNGNPVWSAGHMDGVFPCCVYDIRDNGCVISLFNTVACGIRANGAGPIESRWRRLRRHDHHASSSLTPTGHADNQRHQLRWLGAPCIGGRSEIDVGFLTYGF